MEWLWAVMKMWEERALEYDLFDVSHVFGNGPTSLCIWLPMVRERSGLETSYPRRMDTSSTLRRKPKNFRDYIYLTVYVVRLGVSAE
jgi:hypothetical protein